MAATKSAVNVETQELLRLIKNAATDLNAKIHGYQRTLEEVSSKLGDGSRRFGASHDGFVGARE